MRPSSILVLAAIAAILSLSACQAGRVARSSAPSEQATTVSRASTRASISEEAGDGTVEQRAVARPDDTGILLGIASAPARDAASPPPGGEAPALHRQAPELEARDLGSGAGGEKLGEPRRSREEGGGELERGFTRCAAPGGDASTFASDVDTASYTHARAELGQGRAPRRDEVRTEEFINAFRYDYPAPGWFDEHPFRFDIETVACPWREAHQIVRIGINTKAMNPSRRPSANLVFLIDVSGSMAEANKLPLIKKSFSALVAQLRREDRVAVVTYAGQAGVALEPTPGDEHRRILRCIERLEAGGSTAGEDGLRTAYRLARENFRKEAANRVILATDGDFNVGETGNDALVRLIRSEADDSIYLTALGFGMGDYQDHRLERLARDGHGMYAYIDDEREARRLFVEQLPASLVPMAQEVKIQVFFNPAAVRGWRLLGYEDRVLARRDFNDDRVEAGVVGAGHAVTALYEIIPAQVVADADPNPFVAGERPQRRERRPDYALRLRLRYQKPGGGRSILMEHDLPCEDAPSTPSTDTSWAMAMAALAMQLQDSPYRGACDWRLVRRLAQAGQGGGDADERSEAVDLIERARRLARVRD